MGGVVVNDFIDMKEERHRRNVEETFRKSLRRDRSRTKILKTSSFGLIEMTRQRVQTSLKRTAYSECSHCRGTGLVKTPQSMCIEVMRIIQLAASANWPKRSTLQSTLTWPIIWSTRNVETFSNGRTRAGLQSRSTAEPEYRRNSLKFAVLITTAMRCR